MSTETKVFTFYWRDGKREVFPGTGPADALNHAGYGGGAIAALDFYAEGDNHNWKWVAETREWVPTVAPEPVTP